MMIGWGCAVWGTGWYYPPYGYYGGFYPAYYGYPHTYGMGAWYNPYTGGYGRGYAAYGPYGGVGMGAVLQSADRNLRARRRGLWPVRIAFGGPGLQPAHRHLRADPPGFERLRQLGQQLGAARRRLGADGAPDQLPDGHADERRSDRQRRRRRHPHRT